MLDACYSIAQDTTAMPAIRVGLCLLTIHCRILWLAGRSNRQNSHYRNVTAYLRSGYDWHRLPDVFFSHEAE